MSVMTHLKRTLVQLILYQSSEAHNMPTVTYPHAISSNVTKTMRGNKATDSKPELTLRRALWKHGIRGYRLHCKDLPGKPDLCFRAKQTIVFVHGCFWHSCPACKISKPRHNAPYWSTKLEGNVARDEKHVQRLGEMGWQVVVVWECQIKKDLAACITLIESSLKQASTKAPKS